MAVNRIDHDVENLKFTVLNVLISVEHFFELALQYRYFSYKTFKFIVLISRAVEIND